LERRRSRGLNFSLLCGVKRPEPAIS
jgi:hypothetical protein